MITYRRDIGYRQLYQMLSASNKLVCPVCFEEELLTGKTSGRIRGRECYNCLVDCHVYCLDDHHVCIMCRESGL